MLKDIATLTLDTSGIALHKRGYRTLSATAPIKETLAASLIHLGRWYPDIPFIDPFCGSGTIPIEAALIARNIAPGLKREFAAEHWGNIIPHKYWSIAREEANDAINRNIECYIMGTDIDDKVLSLARYHAKQAGVESDIHFQRIPVAELRTSKKYGTIICNPPYGERLSEKKEVENLYREMGRVFRSFDTWSYHIFSGHMEFERYFRKRADKKRKLFNGRILCYLYQYLGPRPAYRNEHGDRRENNE